MRSSDPRYKALEAQLTPGYLDEAARYAEELEEELAEHLAQRAGEELERHIEAALPELADDEIREIIAMPDEVLLALAVEPDETRLIEVARRRASYRAARRALRLHARARRVERQPRRRRPR